MTPRERVMTALRRRQPDRVPYGIGGFNREGFRRFREKTGFDDPDEYFGIEKNIEGIGFADTQLDLKKKFLKFHDLPEENYRKTLPDVPEKGVFTLKEWGTATIVGSDISYDHFVPPQSIVRAKSIKDIENYPLPDITSGYRYSHLDKAAKEIKGKGLASIATMAMTIFEVAWMIRGFNELLTDFLTQEDWATCLLDRITELRTFQARKFAEAGADIIQLGDDVGMEHKLMMSPDVWRKWLKPRLARVIKSAEEIKPDVVFFYHSDGYIEPIIPDLIEIGVDILNPIQPECMDPAKIKRQYGDELAFWGTLGIQHTLPFGTPEEVQAEVRERIETVGRNGGLYLSPTHCIAPEVPYENIFAFVEAVDKYGRY